MYLDVSQVESAIWSLAPWLLDYEIDGEIRLRNGNDDPGAPLHGAFACADEGGVSDRWVTIACWSDDELTRLHGITGLDVEAWTRARTPSAVAAELQAAGIEAVPVEDFGDLNADPQLAHRKHFEAHAHPVIGDGLYEHTGTRYTSSPRAYDRAGPTLGQDNDWAQGEVLGLSAGEIEALTSTGAVE